MRNLLENLQIDQKDGDFPTTNNHHSKWQSMKTSCMDLFLWLPWSEFIEFNCTKDRMISRLWASLSHSEVDSLSNTWEFHISLRLRPTRTFSRTADAAIMSLLLLTPPPSPSLSSPCRWSMESWLPSCPRWSSLPAPTFSAAVCVERKASSVSCATTNRSSTPSRRAPPRGTSHSASAHFTASPVGFIWCDENWFRGKGRRRIDFSEFNYSDIFVRLSNYY